MKQKVATLIYFVILTLGLCGCASNPDPGEGGFFDGLSGIITGKYEERKQEKQTELNEVEQENVELDEENISLREEYRTLEEMRSVYDGKLKKMEKHLDDLEIKLIHARTKNEGQSKRKKEIEQKLTDLKREVRQDRAEINTTDETEMQDELSRLSKEKKRVEQQIVELTSIE